MELWELEARESIRELIATYTHLGDGGRIDEMMQLFKEDSVLKGESDHVGLDAIRAFFTNIAEGKSGGPPRSFIRHYISNVTIDLASRTEASGAAYWTVISDVGLESSGRYRDTYRRGDDGTWRFHTRKIGRDVSKL